MRNFKNTRYIQLLYNEEEIKDDELEIAFADFTEEVYQFCSIEHNYGFKYFTLQYLKALLVMFQAFQQNEKTQKIIKGALTFIDAAIEWIKKKDNYISQHYDERKGDETLPPIIWTGKVIHLMEFIYGSDTMKNFNNGQATIKEVSAYFSKMLGVEIKDPSGCYVSMRERIKESRTSYIDSMREALLERMEKDDEKTYRRKK